MVQTDISQFAVETAEWRPILRSYREEFSEYKKLLCNNTHQITDKEQLQELEHFDNQFHIQLLNIHDLKKEIKQHEKQLQLELSKNDYISHTTFLQHEHLLAEFLSLESRLQLLRNSFRDFINESSC